MSSGLWGENGWGLPQAWGNPGSAVRAPLCVPGHEGLQSGRVLGGLVGLGFPCPLQPRAPAITPTIPSSCPLGCVQADQSPAEGQSTSRPGVLILDHGLSS